MQIPSTPSRPAADGAPPAGSSSGSGILLLSALLLLAVVGPAPSEAAPAGDAAAESPGTPGSAATPVVTTAAGSRAVVMSSRQDPFAGGVEGEVTDREGAGLASVRVVLRQGEQRFESWTGEGGRFRFPGIRPGSWTLEVEGKGYEPVRHGSVQVRLGRVTTVHVRLAEVVEETIIVTSEPPWTPPGADTARVRLGSSELEQIPAGRDPFGALGSVPGVEVDRPRHTAASALVGGGAAADASTFRVDGIDVARPTYITTAASAGRLEVISGGADASVPGPGVVVLLTSPERSPRQRVELAASHVNPSWQALASSVDDFPSGDLALGDPALSPVPGSEVSAGGGSRLERSTLWSLDASGNLWRDRIWIWGAAQRRELEESRPDGVRPRSELTDSAAKIQSQAWSGGSIAASLYRNDWRRLGDGAGPDRAPETLRAAFEPSRWSALEVSQLLREDLRLGLSLHGSDDAARITPSESESELFPENRIVQGEDGVWRGGFAALGREIQSRGWRLELEGIRRGGLGGHEITTAVEHRLVETAEEEHWGAGGYQLLAGENFGTPFDLLRARRSGSLRLRRATTSFWIQDHLAVADPGSRRGDWSLDFGLRFDLQDGTTGAGRAPANSLFPELLPEVSYAGGDTVSWLDLSPRLAFAWTIGETKHTTLRTSLGRFSSPLGAGVVGRLSPLGQAEVVLGGLSTPLLELEAGDIEDLGKNPDLVVIDRLGVDPFVPGSATHPNSNAEDLASEKTDELRLSVERRLGLATSLRLEWVSRIVSDVLETRRFLRDETGIVRLARASDYVLETVVRGQFPDGSPYSAPVYGLRAGLELTGGALLTNGDRQQRYQAVTLGLERRLTRGFRLRAHATLSDWRWHVGEEFASYDDPTDTAPGDGGSGGSNSGGGSLTDDDDGGAVLQPGAGPGRYVHGRWSFDMAANWHVAPQRSWGFDLALHLHGREGYPIPYYVPVVAGDRIRRVQAGDYDTYRLDDVVTVNLRLAKELELRGLRTVVSLDTFNLLNDTSVFERDARLGGPQAGLVRETVSPRVFQLGFRVSWR